VGFGAGRVFGWKIRSWSKLRVVPRGGSNGTKRVFNDGSALFQPGWKFEVFAEVGDVFVDGEAGAESSEFDNVAVRVVEVDGFEVDAIHDGGNAQASFKQFFAPGKLGFFTGDGEGEVLGLSGTHAHAAGYVG